MRRLTIVILAMMIVATVFTSCSHGISIQEAANGKAKCGRNHLR
jgi:hypothetical protein